MVKKANPKRDAGRKNSAPAAKRKVPGKEYFREIELELQKRDREIAEAAERQAATSEILRIIANSPTDIQPVLDVIAERAAIICDAEACQIRLVEGDHLVVASNYGDDRQFSVGSLVAISRQTVSGRAVIDREMIHIPNLLDVLEEYPLIAERVRRGGTESWLVAPLLRESVALGTIHIRSYQIRPFSEKQISQLKVFADQAVIAIENVRLFTETQRLLKETEDRAAELAVINSVQEGLASKLDMQEIYDLVGDELTKIFNAQVVMISTYDRATETIEHCYAIERGERVYAPGRHPIRGFRIQIVETRKPVLVNANVAELAERLGQPTLPGTLTPKSWLGVPMIVGDKVTGILSLQNVEEEEAFNEADVRLLETFAASMSVALENARLFGETQRLLKETEQRNAELQIINSVQAGLASKLDLQAIYELIGEKVREVFNVQVVDIVGYDAESNLISMPYSYEKSDRSVISPREPYGFRKQVIDSAVPLLINENFTELASQYNNPLLTGKWPKSALFVPLVTEGRVKGVISIQDIDRENAFSRSDVQLLQTLANAMSVAIENARLFDETQRLLKETDRRARELATVNTVSAALAGELDLDTLIDLVGEQIRTVFKADIAFVAVLDRESGVIDFPYQYGQHLEPIRFGQGLTSRIIQSGGPLLINQDMDRQRQQMGVTLIGRRAQSFLGVPIFVGGEAVGVVSVQSTKEEGLFTEDDQRLLSTIAASVGVAFRNARLFDETQRLFKAEKQAHEQAETLRSVAQALNHSLSLTEVFDLVLTEIQKVIPYDSAGIYQVFENRRMFVAGRGFANLDELRGLSFEFNQRDDEIGYLISKSLLPLILDDAPQKYPQYFGSGSHAATKIRSYMAVPIVLNRKLIGMITLDREEPGFYRNEHASLAMAFAAQAATAINNARLFDETQERNAELQIINSVQEGLASKLEMREIYELVGDKIRDIFHNADMSIVMHDPATNLLQVSYAFEHGKRFTHEPFPLPTSGFFAHVLRTGKTLVINENAAQAFEKYGGRILSGPTEKSGEQGPFTLQAGSLVESNLYMEKSTVRVPLMVGGQTRGVVTLEDMEREHAFSESDVRLLETLANSMSVALENARLWEQEKLYRKALQRELEIGREIQAGFLPETLPSVQGWEIAASLISAREVAGDFYDAFELPDGSIGLVIADVCDKGVGAALFMTLFRSLVRVIASQDYFEHFERTSHGHSTAERLKRTISLTNNYIAETHEKSGMFATLFFGILDPHDGRLIYINGGHEPPVILRGGRVRETLHKTGPAVGAIINSLFEIRETQVQPGEILFCFTDGVPDCKNPQGEFYGREQLTMAFQRAEGSAQDAVESIVRELNGYTSGATRFDDIAMLAARRG